MATDILEAFPGEKVQGDDKLFDFRNPKTRKVMLIAAAIGGVLAIFYMLTRGKGEEGYDIEPEFGVLETGPGAGTVSESGAEETPAVSELETLISDTLTTISEQQAMALEETAAQQEDFLSALTETLNAALSSMWAAPMGYYEEPWGEAGMSPPVYNPPSGDQLDGGDISPDLTQPKGTVIPDISEGEWEPRPVKEPRREGMSPADIMAAKLAGPGVAPGWAYQIASSPLAEQKTRARTLAQSVAPWWVYQQGPTPRKAAMALRPAPRPVSVPRPPAGLPTTRQKAGRAAPFFTPSPRYVQVKTPALQPRSAPPKPPVKKGAIKPPRIRPPRIVGSRPGGPQPPPE